ncbi:MAG: putative rane protein [Acidobacteria bacterium]|nr:putative rane protein [Acidobacteriota bacterium]
MPRLLARVRVALASAALLWAVLVVAAPWLGSRREPLAAWTAAGTYLAGGRVCHQRPERSFHAAGAQLPVCARCTGLYLSAAAGALAGLAWPWPRRVSNALRAPAFDWRPWLAAAALPTAATVALEWAGLWAPSNAARALAGVPLGAAAGLLVTVGLSFRGRL